MKGLLRKSYHELPTADVSSCETTKKWINLPNLDPEVPPHPKRPGWWHADDMFIWAVYRGSKSPQACSGRKDDSLYGAPCVFRRKGESLGVNSVTLREVDLAGLTPEFLWTGQPRVTLWANWWGICTWRTEDLETPGVRTATQVHHFFGSCVIHLNKNTWGSRRIKKNNSLRELRYERLSVFLHVFSWSHALTSKHPWNSI